jgi:hypothetical protein
LVAFDRASGLFFALEHSQKRYGFFCRFSKLAHLIPFANYMYLIREPLHTPEQVNTIFSRLNYMHLITLVDAAYLISDQLLFAFF